MATAVGPSSAGQDRVAGHREGSNAVRRIVRACRKLGMKGLTLYAFSEQNWARPDLEIGALWDLLREFLMSEREEILGNGIRLNAIGNVGKLPALVRTVLEPLRKESLGNNEMVLTLALSYGGREEIVGAAREVARRVAQGSMTEDEITPEMLHGLMPSLEVGDPDLVIRTRRRNAESPTFCSTGSPTLSCTFQMHFGRILMKRICIRRLPATKAVSAALAR